MPPLFTEVAFWHWWILAVLLGIIEMIAPGFFCIWLAGAAALTGVIVLIFSGIGWEAQIVIFAILAMLSLVAWHRIGRRLIKSGGESTLNRRGEQLIGRTVVLTEAIVNGRGTARVNDSIWRVEGIDSPAGSNVTITGVNGTILRVEPAAR
ncbi:MAG TPA: NfeD family protein [Terriglobales bacterium]|nr:NfeD family protein [Terriglobales bacterium]